MSELQTGTEKRDRDFYILERLDHSAGDYDVMNSGIVLANNEAQARELLSECAWDEGADLWLDPKCSSCQVLDKYNLDCRVIETNCNPG